MNVFDGTTGRPSINLGRDPAVRIEGSDPEGYRAPHTKLLQLHRANPALHHAGLAPWEYRVYVKGPLSE